MKDKKVVILASVVGVIFFCLGVCIIAAVVAGGEESDNNDSILNIENNDEVSEVVFNDQGQTKTLGILEYTLNKVEKDGDDYIFSLTIGNNSDEETAYSTLLQISVIDENGKSLSQNIFYDVAESESLDADIPANGEIKGKVVFSAEDNSGKLTLRLEDDLLTGEYVEYSMK